MQPLSLKMKEQKQDLGLLVHVAKKAKQVAEDDPRRIIHSLKVGFALLLICTFYYFRPTFRGFGDNTIWSLITVIIVMEFSVGATLGKGLNRLLATMLGAGLGIGVRFIADRFPESGKTALIPIFMSVTAGVVTFLRFIPELKRYDYGLFVFLMTLGIVTVSDSGEGEMISVAQERILTILLGCLIGVLVCVFICPVWIGQDLHNLIASNLEKLSLFFQEFGDAYFNNILENKEGVDAKPVLEKYKSILSSKSSEESMATLARWEPPHGKFRFRHPWKQYLKLGNVIRQCAYKIEALNSLLHSSHQTPLELRSKIQEACTEISTESGKALKELSTAMKKMTEASMSNMHVTNAKMAAENLKGILKTNPWEGAGVVETTPAATVASLLVDAVVCIGEICEAAQELASLARFNTSELFQKKPVQPISGPDAHHVVNVGVNGDE